MKYINLIDKIPEHDKKIMENYIKLYGTNKHFIGLDEWLQNWSHSNQRLYRLLGNSLTKEFNYTYQKNKDILFAEYKALFIADPFYKAISTFINKYTCEKIDTENFELRCRFRDLISVYTFINDKVEATLKYKREGANKLLQIQAGAKPLKALYRFVNYFKDEIDGYNEEEFENFKTQISLIKNDEKINGIMVLSIHPMDYITMSDNNSNWTSCMSWEDKGCYRVGTVEMMNSNNVVCAYLKSSNKHTFNFNKDQKEDTLIDDYSWNDKKWRTLIYVTKDIIMGGKAYPYLNDNFTKYLIAEVKELAEKNLKWNYTFGPELYQDMKHIYSLAAMENNRHWMAAGSTFKHNIIWDTQGMYNDMLNASIDYWCYRNKVKSTKIISVSGKAPCLCCGQNSLEVSNDCWNEYNERYINTQNIICPECMSKYFLCSKCLSEEKSFYIVDINGEEKRYCQHCFEKYLRECPECGENFELNELYLDDSDYIINPIWSYPIFYKGSDATDNFYYRNERYSSQLFDPETEKDEDIFYHKIYCCPRCEEKLKKDNAVETTVSFRKMFSSRHDKILTVPSEIGAKFNFNNLKKVTNYVED